MVTWSPACMNSLKQFQNFNLGHCDEGVLAMANSGPNTNGRFFAWKLIFVYVANVLPSQFYITFKETRHLDGKHVVFGRLVSGLAVLRKIAAVDTNSQDCPRSHVSIERCGSIQLLGDGVQVWILSAFYFFGSADICHVMYVHFRESLLFR